MAQGAAEGIVEGIGEGLGEIGDVLRQRKQAQIQLRDQQADQLSEKMKAIAQNIVRVGGRDKPEAAQLVQQLEETVRQHNALYPSHEAPALIQRLQKLAGRTPAGPQQDVRSQMTPENAMATAQLPEYATTDEAKRKENALKGEFLQTNAGIQRGINEQTNDAILAWGKRNNLTDDQLKELTATLAGIPASVLKPPAEKSGQWKIITGKINGNPVTLQQSEFDKTITDMAGRPLDPDSLSKFIKDQTTTVHNKQAWIVRDGKPLSVMLDPNNHPIPGTENPDAVPPPALFGRITTTDYIYDDGTGNMISIPKTTTSTPMGVAGAPTSTGAPAAGAPVAPGAGIPRNAAEARGLLTPPTPAGPHVVGPKASKPYTEAKINYDKATGIVELAKAAAVKKEALSDRNLAIRMAREASGRFSMAEYDTVIRNAGLGNTMEQWMNNISSGALPDDIRRQLIAVANDNLAAAKAEMDSASGKPAPTNSIDDEILKKLERLPVH